MEMLDILDKSGNKSGKRKTRDEVHRDGDWHRTIHAWIINSSGQILLQKRSPTKEKYPNVWHISVAGHVIAGDDSETTIFKEAKEELGLKIKHEDIKYLFTNKKSSCPKPDFIENEFQDIYLIKLDADISKLVIDPNEVSDIKYFEWNDFKNMIKDKESCLIVPKYIDSFIETIEAMK